MPLVVTNCAMCTLVRFQACFWMFHVAPETVFWRGRTTTYLLVGQSLSRQAATATTNAFFPSIDRIIHCIERGGRLYPTDVSRNMHTWTYTHTQVRAKEQTSENYYPFESFSCPLCRFTKKPDSIKKSMNSRVDLHLLTNLSSRLISPVVYYSPTSISRAPTRASCFQPFVSPSASCWSPPD